MRPLLIILAMCSMILQSCTAVRGSGNIDSGMKYAGNLVEMRLFDDARMHYERLLGETRDDLLRARIFNNLAVICEMQEEYEMARSYYLKSLELKEDSTVYENYKRFTGGT